MFLWIQLFGVFLFVLVGVMVDMVFFVMVNDEFNFMQDVVDIEDYFIEVSLDESFGFNIII